MNFLIKIILFFFLISTQVKANNAVEWLGVEIDTILKAYENENISNVERFELIENTINQNFAGAGIAKFVAGQAWSIAEKKTKKEYIESFKLHLALNIASMMKGYSGQTYEFINSKKDETSNVHLIDMEIKDKTNKILITWRVKELKDRFYVIDLLAAGISLVITKRSEFNSMLKKIDYNLKVFNKTLKKQNKLSYEKLIQ